MKKQSNHNLRQVSQFSSRSVITVCYGTELLFHIGPKIWNLIPTNIKNLHSVTAFKQANKKWRPETRPSLTQFLSSALAKRTRRR